MDQDTAMQLAADHFAKSEEYVLTGSPQSARLHVEIAKGYVTMARELRIGRHRHMAYGDVWLPKVVLSETPLTATDVESDGNDYDDAVWPDADTLDHAADVVRTPGEIQAEDDESLTDQ